MTTTVRVLVVDDNESMRTSLSLWLSGVPGVAEVALAASGDEAVAELERNATDLVLADVEMPGMSGFQLAFRIIQMTNAPRIVVMSASDRPEYPVLSAKSGADVFILKSKIRDDLSRYLATYFERPPVTAWFPRSARRSPESPL